MQSGKTAETRIGIQGETEHMHREEIRPHVLYNYL